MKLLVGLLIIAAAATTGDYIWYTYGVRHTALAGFLHGALLLTTVGGVLGWLSGALVRGLPIGTLAGIGGAASYYTFVALVDRRTYGVAIPLAWVTMWLMLAALDGRWLRARRPRSWQAIAVRGVAAALFGGVAFYLVLNTLWGRPPAGGRNYLIQFLAWTFAWAPGVIALIAGGAPSLARTTGDGLSSPAGGGESEASIGGAELLARIDRGEAPAILDVRSEGEFAAGRVPGAINIPFTQVAIRSGAVPGTASEELIVYCGHGPRAYIAAATLRSSRPRIVYLRGHWAGWQRDGLRVER